MTDAETFVEENREDIITIIRQSSDSFTRAAAWTLLDKYTPDNDYETLEEELRLIAERGDSA